MNKYDGLTNFKVSATTLHMEYGEIETVKTVRATSFKDAREVFQNKYMATKINNIENYDNIVVDALLTKALDEKVMVHQSKPVSNNPEDAYRRYCILISIHNPKTIIVAQYYHNVNEFETIAYTNKLSDAIRIYHTELGGE